MALRACIVTIDAIGCQREVAAAILEQEADDVLALKDNQPTLHELVVAHFRHASATADTDLRQRRHDTIDKNHGRLEVRHCLACDDPTVLARLDPAGEWPGQHSIAMVAAERRVGATVHRENRYYLSSLPANAKQLLREVRGELDRVGLPGVSDTALDFLLCLNLPLSGERDEPCPLEGV